MFRFIERSLFGALTGFAAGLLLLSGLGACAPPSPGAQGENPADRADDDNEAAQRAQALRIDPEVDHVMGNPEAPNVIIEYGNFLCPACGGFFLEGLSDIHALVEQERAVFVYRHAAFGRGVATAHAAECAAAQNEDAFFDYHDLLFENQQALLDSDEEGMADLLRQYADDLELDPGLFQECLDSGAVEARLTRDAESAEVLGVTHTPTFWVNGEKLVGNRPVEEFEPLLTE